jgi:DNA-binding CsgD family transcriptional regulator
MLTEHNEQPSTPANTAIEFHTLASDLCRKGESSRLAALIATEWPHLIQYPNRLDELLSTFDDSHLNRYPEILLIRSLVHPARRPDTALTRALAEVQGRLSEGHYREDSVKVSVQLASLLGFRAVGDYAAADRHATELQTRILTVPPRSVAEARKLATVSLQAVALKILCGNLTDIRPHLEALIFSRAAYQTDNAGAAAQLALFHALNGEDTVAQGWLDHMRASAPAAPNDQHFMDTPEIAALSAEAIIALDHVDLPQYDAVVGRFRITRSTTVEQLYIWQAIQARASVIRGEQRRTLDEIDTFRRNWPLPAPMASLPHTLLSQAQTDLALSIGDYKRAQSGIPDEVSDYRSVEQLARWQLATGRSTQALHQLERGPSIDQAPRRHNIDLSLLLATARLRMDDAQGSAALVLRAITNAGDPRSILYSLIRADRATLRNAAAHHQTVSRTLDQLGDTLTTYQPPTPHKTPVLTPREQLILRYLATGQTAAQIADTLRVSVHTVRKQSQNIYRKLNATSRQHALDVAAQLKLLDAAD